MKIDYSSFEKALDQLRKSLGFLNSPAAAKDPALREQFRAATIQAFEYSSELTVKMIRRPLAEIGATPSDLAQPTFADLIRSAADARLLKDVKGFLVYRDARNRTSHAYDQETADEVIAVIPDFLRDASFMLSELRERNS